MLKKLIVIQLFIFFIFAIAPIISTAVDANLIQNAGFEQSSKESADNWSTDAWDKNATATEFRIDDNMCRAGSKSALIVNHSANDARFKQEVKVKGEQYYRLSCYVRTEGVGPEGKGANISVEGILETSGDVKGTNPGWEKVEFYGKTEKTQANMVATLGIGGYGSLNTGKAWFDDILIEELDKAPVGVTVVNLYSDAASNTGNTKSTPKSYNRTMLIYASFYLVISCFVFFTIKRNKLELPASRRKFIILMILAAAFIIRVAAAQVLEGWPNDVSANKYWSLAAAKNLFGFYKSGWCDYPPFAIYIFFIIGKIANIPALMPDFTLFVKLPSIIADIITAYMLYFIGKKHSRVEFGLIAAGLYAFHPAVFLNSTIWGQVDSFLTMLVIAALVLLIEGQISISAIFFTAAVLFKPQGVFFLPILLFALLKRKSMKEFLKASLYSLITAVLIILPFSFKQDPLWIFKLYLNTASEYKAVLMNAFNFFGLFGANFKDADSIFFIFSYNVWGLIFTILILGFTGFIYFKGKSIFVPVICALLLNTGVFVFSTKMHERYMFPAIAIILMAFLLLREQRLLIIFTALSVTIFFNIHILFYRMLLYGLPGAHMPSRYVPLIVFSLFNVIIYFYIIKVSVDIVVRNRIYKTRIGELHMKETAIKPNAPIGRILIEKLTLDRKDILIMAVLTSIYLIIALFNLGSFNVPKTSWQPSKPGESFVLELGKEVNVSRIYFYWGLNDRKFDGSKYNIEYADNTGTFCPLTSFNKENLVYVWKYQNVSAITNRIKIAADSAGGTLNEVCIFEAGSKAPLSDIKIIEKKVSLADVGKVENLFDEQNTVEYAPSFMTGTYFDEIYHARTAVEHLTHIEPYETTHPPLGKILISLGVLIFGVNPFGWRIIGTLFGAAMIPLMYIFGKKLFNKRFYAFCIAFLMMFDFMHFAQTRIATIDVYGTFFIILMYYFIYDYFANKSYTLGFKQSLKPLFLSGLFFGLGAASKWIALYGAAGLALLFFATKYTEYRDYTKSRAYFGISESTAGSTIKKGRRSKKIPSWLKDFFPLYINRTILYCILFFIIIPAAIYILSYIPFMSVPGPGHGFIDVWKSQLGMYDYHSNLVATHPFSSTWWSWPFDTKPVWFYMGSDMPGGKVSSIVSMGNPAIWWLGIPALIAAAFIAVKKRDRKMVVIFTALLFQYLPWVFIHRLAFIYHFFSSIPFVIITIIYVFKHIIDKYPRAKYALYVYLCIVAILFIVFYPVLSGMQVDKAYVDSLKWFRSWIF